jgi:hypothetical protein
MGLQTHLLNLPFPRILMKFPLLGPTDPTAQTEPRPSLHRPARAVPGDVDLSHHLCLTCRFPSLAHLSTDDGGSNPIVLYIVHLGRHVARKQGIQIPGCGEETQPGLSQQEY